MSSSLLSQTALMFGGEVFDGRDAEHPLIALREGAPVVARVRMLPAKDQIEPTIGFLDLYDKGSEHDILKLCVQVRNGDEWKPADDVFVGSLTDASHDLLFATAEKLNFKRAVSLAERAIARGTALLPLKKNMAETMLAPVGQVLESWISSATSQISEALAALKR